MKKVFLVKVNNDFIPNWEEEFMQAAFNASRKSHCSKVKVGAVIAHIEEKGKEVFVQTGYNGPVKGESHCNEIGCCKVREGYCCGSHAEMNAITNAAGSSVDMTGATLFITLSPCMECVKHIANSSLKEVVYLYNYGDVFPDKKEEADKALALLRRRKPCRLFIGKIIGPDGDGNYKVYEFK